MHNSGLTQFIAKLVELIQQSINRAVQVSSVQFQSDLNPNEPFGNYCHYVARKLLNENPQMEPNQAFIRAIRIANKEIDTYIYSNDIDKRQWARNIKKNREDYRLINARTADELNKIHELIILENYGIQLFDAIDVHQNATFEQKFKKIFRCSDFQKMCRNNQNIARLRTQLNF